MNDQRTDASILSLQDWKEYIDELEIKPLFVTISGAHIYGFPSPDSDVDLRSCHKLELDQIVGLTLPNETLDFDSVRNGIEVDLVSHEVGKYFRLLVKNNGYILEQIFSPLVVSGNDFLNQLRPLAQNCITKNHYYHYRGFYASQKKLIEKQEPVTAKAVLYAYRVLCTGVHLMRTGVIQTDLRVLATELNLSFIQELIAAKQEEKVSFKYDVQEHLNKLADLELRLEQAFAESKLPENPDRQPVNDFLVQLRLEAAL